MFKTLKRKNSYLSTLRIQIIKEQRHEIRRIKIRIFNTHSQNIKKQQKILKILRILQYFNINLLQNLTYLNRFLLTTIQKLLPLI